MVGVQINPISGLPSGFPVLHRLLFLRSLYDFTRMCQILKSCFMWILQILLTGIAPICARTCWRQKCRSPSWGMIFFLARLPFTLSSLWLRYVFTQDSSIQGLIEAREELRPLLLKSNDRLRDLLFLDIALDSSIRTAVERGYEELNRAKPEVCTVSSISISTTSSAI